MAAFDPNDPDMKYLAVDRKALMKEQTVPFDGKKMCWVPDEKEGFLAAEIQSTKGDEITVKTIEGNEVNSHPRTKYQNLNFICAKERQSSFICKIYGSFCILRTAQ